MEVDAMRKGVVWAGAWLVLALVAGCGDEAECPAGYVEMGGRCLPPLDAGAEGGGSDVDAGEDAGSPEDGGPRPDAARDAEPPLEAGPDGCTMRRWYLDGDGDGFGDPEAVTEACEQPSNHVDNADDCDDRCPTCHPGGTETCDGADNDCDGATDEDDAEDAPTWYRDADEDGFGDAATSRRACSTPPGYVDNADDCDDGCSSCRPGGTEACDGVDNDCDGMTDEAGATGERTWYRDADGDGYGRATDTVRACSMPTGYVDNADDCGDGRRHVHPGAPELCDGHDDDCDGLVDEDPSSGEPPLCSDSSTPVCYEGSCLCRPQITGVVGNYQLLVPGGSYTLCGSCLADVNRVRIGGVLASGVSTGVTGCAAGEESVRFTVPSGIGGGVNVYASVAGQGRRSDPYRVTVGELRINEVKAGDDTTVSRYYSDYIEICVVDPTARTTGLAAVPLEGYRVAAYEWTAGNRTGLWSLTGKQTAAGGCMAMGHSENRPATFSGASWIAFAEEERLDGYVGGLVIGRGALPATASALRDSQIMDAMIYDANWITDGTPPSSLSNLLNPGAARVVPKSQYQGISSFLRCGTYLHNLRDGRAWIVDRPLTLGQLANDCP